MALWANVRVLKGSNTADQRPHLHFFFALGLAFVGGVAAASRASRSAFRRSRFFENAAWAISCSLMCRCGIYLAKRPARFPLGLGDLLWWFNFARCLRHFFAFGRSTRASLNSSGPFSSRLLRLARSSALAAPSAKLSITLAASSLARVAFSCVGFTRTVSPSSNSRRIAAERVASLAVAQASTSAINVAGIRVVAGRSRPVGGLPARAFR